MIKSNNFYIVFYWMINELGLKGSELPVFAIIYSFSQDSKCKFTGSLNYIAELSGMSKRGVIKVLDRLLDKKVIIKEQTIKNNVKYNSYQVNFEVVNKVQWGSEQRSSGVVNSVHQGSEQRSPNNNIYNNIDNKLIKDIVEYLNIKTGSNYKWQSKDTQRHINARFDDGYTFDDFKKVIDNKCVDWLGDVRMSKFLRPSTLFGTKFESYLNQNHSTHQTYCEY